MAEIAATASSPADIRNRNLRAQRLIIIFGVFAITMASPVVLAGLPLRFLLKGEVHVTQEQMALFFFWCQLAFYLKPLAGILTDAFPIFGTRRRHYLLISSVLAASSWIGMNFLPHKFGAILFGAMVVNLFMVMASTVIGGYLVEAGQSNGATGELTALRLMVANFCELAQGPLGGFLATAGFIWTTVANAVVALAIFPLAYFFLREQAVPQQGSGVVLQNARRQLKAIMRSKSLWMALLFIGLDFFAPGFNTPLYYKQTDELHFSQQAIGNLGAFSGGFAILAAIAYVPLIKQFSIRVLLFISILATALETLFYLFYSDWPRAMLIESQNGFFSAFATVALFDLAARSIPKACEALGYSLIMSVINVASSASDVVGSHLADNHWTFAHLIYLNAGTTAIVLVLLPFLPSALMRKKDAVQSTEILPEPA